MKKHITFILLITLFISCKSEVKKETHNNEKVEQKESKYPKALGEIFEHHGGIEAWRNASYLSFSVKGEKHTTDLRSRRAIVKADDYSLGYDGKEVWLKQKDSIFKSNPEFYYNLYFYFYAMPFVLADDGIIYSETAPIEYEGISYPGIKISYKANVGVSPDDNYFIFYHPESKEMAWLGYTVTYYSKKPSDKFKIIRYNDWENVNGFLLPKSITWYKKNEQGVPTEPAGEPTEFSSAVISQTSLADDFFSQPAE